MGWDGAGGYTRQRNFSGDASANIKILASAMDQEIDDMASAFTNCWALDGQNTPTGDVSLGGNRLINGGAAQSVSDYIRVKEIIENVPIYMEDTASSADVVSASAQFFTSVSAGQAPTGGTKIMVRAGSDKRQPVMQFQGHSANIHFPNGGRVDGLVSGAVYEFTYNSADSVWETGIDRLYPQTSAESSAGVTPTNYQYIEGDSRRYGAAFDGTTDDSAAHQAALDVLAQKGGGTWAIKGGVSKALGIVCKASHIEIVGDGWLEPTSNAVTATVLQFGDDASDTSITHIKGHIRVGDRDGAFASWTNITGVKFERMVEADLRIDATGCGVGIDMAADGTTGSGSGAVAYNQFRLGDITNNKIGLQFDVASGGGYANENLWLGGRFTINSGTYASGATHIKINNNGGNQVNGNVFVKPSFEGLAAVLDWDGADFNHIIKARWECTLTGTEGVDYPAIFFNLESNSTDNTIEIGQGHNWTTTNTDDLGATTRSDDATFTISGDHTAQLFVGAPIVLTISGTDYTVFVMRSTYSNPDTTVRVSMPVVTGNPSATKVARVSNAGTQNSWECKIRIDGASSDEVIARFGDGYTQCYPRSNTTLSAINADMPALNFYPGGSESDYAILTHSFDGTVSHSLTHGGHQYSARMSIGDVTTPIASRTHVADPSGGGTQDAEARTAINSILSTLEAFGLHKTS